VLEQLFFPRKIRRIRRCWLAGDIEQYLVWLQQRGFSEHLIRNRVPPLVHFGRFTRERGVRSREQLPDHVDAFVAQYGRQCRVHTREARKERRWRGRRAVEQMLRLTGAALALRRDCARLSGLPARRARAPRHHDPCARASPAPP